jgi:hypothetical protein
MRVLGQLRRLGLVEGPVLVGELGHLRGLVLVVGRLGLVGGLGQLRGLDLLGGQGLLGGLCVRGGLGLLRCPPVPPFIPIHIFHQIREGLGEKGKSVGFNTVQIHGPGLPVKIKKPV